MKRSSGIGRGIYKSALVRRAARWLAAIPHPVVAIEFAFDRLAGVRWNRAGVTHDIALEPLPPGAIIPSAVENNLANASAVKDAFASVCKRLNARDEDVTLLLPDPAIRVFVQHFDEFPRSPQYAIPILRWKLKKSVPFAIDETLISYMRQASRNSGVEIIVALARQSIIREYHELAESVGLRPGIILSSALAAMALLEGERTVLMARVSDCVLTSAVVRDNVLCSFRCTELPASGKNLTPQMLLDEIFPLAAYHQDTWHEGIHSVRLAGLGEQLPAFASLLESEFHCQVQSLMLCARSGGLLQESAAPLVNRDLEALAGWMLNRT